jgi:FAD/FMN-containing dehydrogenase
VTAAERELAGWGRWPRRRCRIRTPAAPEAVPAALGPRAIARGLGRGYGDCALAPALTLSTRRLDRLRGFDPATGALEAEAGVALGEIVAALLPQGWFPAVTPGTKFVTLGGAIAADVHGKNHHGAGSFGDHVLWFDLVGADRAVRRCAPDLEPDLFRATLGGMGLTGVVTRAAIRLRPVETAWIRQRTIAAPDLDAAIAAFEANLAATYSVAWIDCLARGAARGRSLVQIGEHARRDELPAGRARTPLAARTRAARRMPLDAPAWTLNGWSVRAFNALYFRAGARAAPERLVDWDSYFYPLDALLDWNRIYGRRGFAQHQSALPLAVARDALAEMLEAVAAAGLGAFLAVLKRFGPGAPDRPLSFPIEGYTLALDLPLAPEALTLMDRLDEITLAAGGRLYLAKDARMSQRVFEAGYGAGRDAFARLVEAERQAAGAGATRFESLQSRRLGL